LERAGLLLEQGRYRDAENQIKQILEQDPENDNALSMLGRCYVNNGEYDKGIEVINKAITIEPEIGYYHYLLGFANYHKNQHPEAINHLTKAIELDPYNPGYFGLMAFVYIDERNFNRGLFYADEGLSLDPNSISCLNARSMALNKLRRTDEAIETMQDALARHPDNELTHNSIGWNLLEKGKNKTALKHFREALRINPDNTSAKNGLKESLKSKIPPYKWLLQFSFWVNNKGKNFRWGFGIALFIIIRVLVSLSKDENGFENFGLIIAGCYFIFVATSWIINPLANVFLLFHKDGKHALDHSEKWNAIAFMICILSGIAVLILTSLPMNNEQEGRFIASGLIIISLSIPTGHMLYPIKFRQNTFKQWISIFMIVLAFFSVLSSIFNSQIAYLFFGIYFLLFVVYSWSK